MTKNEYGMFWRKSHPLYSTHMAMLQRCGQKRGCRSESNFRRYRDRGIRVCDEWLRLRNFEAWAMSHGWRKGLQIDRIDPDRGYDPDNCRFVTPKENARHRRLGNLMVTYRGQTMCLAECVERFADGLSYDIVRHRLGRGWTLQEAMIISAGKHRKSATTVKR